jgi:UDP-3-O-[3-hydroxymyristoyl] glucosamine N-acyltransferase
MQNFPISSVHFLGLESRPMSAPSSKHPVAGLRSVSHGKNFKVVLPANLYGCTFGDDCFVGPFVEIQSGVRVGHRTRIQSHSFVCSKVKIGNDCFIGHGVMFVNDLFRIGRPSTSSSDWGLTTLEDHVAVGSNATILPVRICTQAVIGAGSVVTKDILEPGIYAGSPARKLRSL